MMSWTRGKNCNLLVGYQENGTVETIFKSSFFEIFNERVYDLLSTECLDSNLPVREDTSGVYVEGL